MHYTLQWMWSSKVGVDYVWSFYIPHFIYCVYGAWVHLLRGRLILKWHPHLHVQEPQGSLLYISTYGSPLVSNYFSGVSFCLYNGWQRAFLPYTYTCTNTQHVSCTQYKVYYKNSTYVHAHVHCTCVLAQLMNTQTLTQKHTLIGTKTDLFIVSHSIGRDNPSYCMLDSEQSLLPWSMQLLSLPCQLSRSKLRHSDKHTCI